MGRGPYLLDTRLAIRPLCLGSGRRRYRHRKDKRRPPTGVLAVPSPLPPIRGEDSLIVSSRDNSFCYADDLGLLFIGDSLEETSQQLVEVYKTITLSGAASGLPFSLEKTEIQHFSKQRKTSAPTVTLPGVGEIKPSPYTRWLGVVLDSKLTFRPHINWVLSRGKRLALYLRKLNNT